MTLQTKDEEIQDMKAEIQKLKDSLTERVSLSQTFRGDAFIAAMLQAALTLGTPEDRGKTIAGLVSLDDKHQIAAFQYERLAQVGQVLCQILADAWREHPDFSEMENLKKVFTLQAAGQVLGEYLENPLQDGPVWGEVGDDEG